MSALFEPAPFSPMNVHPWLPVLSVLIDLGEKPFEFLFSLYQLLLLLVE